MAGLETSAKTADGAATDDAATGAGYGATESTGADAESAGTDA